MKAPVVEDGGRTSLSACLQRSAELQVEVIALLEEGGVLRLADDSDRVATSCDAAELALEHWRGVWLLLEGGSRRTATATIRLEFEAVLRSAWLLYAATDDEVATLQQDLSVESERQSGAQAFLGLMLKALSTKGPPELYRDLTGFHMSMGKPLNSYVHSGIHALKRGPANFPDALAVGVLKIANAVGSMAGMMLAKLAGDIDTAQRLNRLLARFDDCLPPRIDTDA